MKIGNLFHDCDFLQKISVDFFKKNFDFTGRETVAIMGAHTFGLPKKSYRLPYHTQCEGLS